MVIISTCMDSHNQNDESMQKYDLRAALIVLIE